MQIIKPGHRKLAPETIGEHHASIGINRHHQRGKAVMLGFLGFVVTSRDRTLWIVRDFQSPTALPRRFCPAQGLKNSFVTLPLCAGFGNDQLRIKPLVQIDIKHQQAAGQTHHGNHQAQRQPEV